MTHFMRRLIPQWKLAAVALLLCINGCFSSLFTLGPPDAAKTSRIYVGDWIFSGNDGKENTRMSIRNFDGKSYVVCVEPIDENGQRKDQPEWYRGFTADVKDVTFAHLKKLNTDGSLGDKWEISRIAVTDGGKLAVRLLNDEFFKDKSIRSDDDLRKIVEANIDNAEMYSGETALVGRLDVK